jgi:hypothetical protein
MLYVCSYIHLHTVIAEALMLLCVVFVLTVFDHLHKMCLLIVFKSCEVVRMEVLYETTSTVPPSCRGLGKQCHVRCQPF